MSLSATGALAVFEMSPGVIVDPERQTAYLMLPGGGIHAVDLRSGETLWESAVAAKPLLLHDDLLYAQAEPKGGAGALHIVSLKAKSGEAAGFAVALELPDGVSASVEHDGRDSFAATARMQDGAMFVSWSFSRAATRRSEKPHLRRAILRVDLKSGQAERIEPGEAPVSPGPRLPEAVARADERGTLLRAPRHVGDWFSAPAHAEDDEAAVVLKRWQATSGEPAADVPLFDGEATIRYASTDDRHLLASRLDVEGDRQNRYVWSIFSLEDGERVATVRRPLVAARFFLSGSSLLHLSPAEHRLVDGERVEAPPAIHAVHVETGATLWTIPVRDFR